MSNNAPLKPSENISRRDLIKLMVLAGPLMYQPTALLADVVPGQPAKSEMGADRRLGHPRLFYNATSLEHLKQTLATDSAAMDSLKKHGEELLAASLIPETTAMHGEGQHASYGQPAKQMSEMGITLGLLYHLTGEKRYADKLREAMLYYTNYARWAGQSFMHRSPPWHSELDTATFSFGYATGYDALHGFLSEPDRKTIADAMVRLAVLPTLNDWVLPGARIHSFDSMGHNWWGVCVAGAGLCALALLDDDPRAQGWIDAMDAGFEQWFNYSGNFLENRVPSFERSGPSYESVAYTNYAVSEYLHYRLAWQNTYPGRKPAHMTPLDHVARYFLHTLYPTSTGYFTLNFNDCALGTDTSTSILLLIACGLGTPEATRYLELVHSNPQGALFPLLRQYPKPAAATDVPDSCIYPEMGWAMLRSSWENDATFLAVKSGYTWNHAHADAGSFVLFKQGSRLIIDSGTCSYNRPEYSTYYRQSRAHNVILFDGAGQPKDDILNGCKFPGHVHGLVDGLGMKYVYADATGPMARWFLRNYRHWFWSNDVILIIDDVWAHTAGQMDWLLHYEGKYTTAADGSIRLKNGPAEAVVKMLYPAIKLREDMGLADHDPDKQVPYLVFSPDAPLQSRQFITAICLNPDAQPKFEILEEQDYLGIRMQTPEGVEEFYLNLRAIRTPGTISVKMGEWVTDAYSLHFKYVAADDKTVQRFFVVNGSYLRHEGRSMFESLTKRTVCWQPGDPLEIFSDSTSANIQIAAKNLPRSVNWNGRPVSIQYDQQSDLVSVRI